MTTLKAEKRDPQVKAKKLDVKVSLLVFYMVRK